MASLTSDSVPASGIETANDSPTAHAHGHAATATAAAASAASSVRSSFPRFPKLDIHTHIIPEQIPDFTSLFGYGNFIRLDHHCECRARMFQGQQFFREIEDNCYRGEPRIRDCDESGVTVQVLSTIPVMFSYWARPEDCLEVCRFLNDHIADLVRKYPKRFVGLATIPMQAPALAIAELKRSLELGLVGVQIGTHVNDLPLGDSALFPIFQACEQLGAAVFVHPWDMSGQDLMKKYWLPWLVGMPAETSFAICSMIFSGNLEKLPNLRICFAHGGGSFPGTIGRIEHGFHCRPDLVAVDNPRNPREYLSRFFIDSLVHDKVALKGIVDLLGASQIILGSDYPFPLGEETPGLLVENSDFLSAEEKSAILWRNGLRFLGLESKEEFFLSDSEANENEEKHNSAAAGEVDQFSANKAELAELDRVLLAESQAEVEKLNIAQQTENQ